MTHRYKREVVRSYAKRWWDGRNPAYLSFSDDCTNFISQCIFAGGIKKEYTSNVESGFWYRGNGNKTDTWSFSWTMSHSLRWYLASESGQKIATRVKTAKEMKIGDVISMDWDGDGAWHHTAVVVGFDKEGEPLVAAHSRNSYNRLWNYKTSPAWTPKTAYIFWHILDELPE